MTYSNSKTRSRSKTLLECGELPIAAICQLASREGVRPRPIYGVHKWFARRLGVVFRSLLVAANLEPDDDFWKGYYGSCNLEDQTVLDPFVGGGTSVVEAKRLGANCIGVDVDPVACAVSCFELDAWSMPDLGGALQRLKDSVGESLRKFHSIALNTGEIAEVLHHFWVQAVPCPRCDRIIEAHPNYVLGEFAGHTWVICSQCNAIEQRRAGIENFRCSECGTRTKIRHGVSSHGVLTCSFCRYSEALIEIARRQNTPPRWELFAHEVYLPREGDKPVDISDRLFIPATRVTKTSYSDAAQELKLMRKNATSLLPDALISSIERADDRITAYGYKSWLDLFNDRQLLHLAKLQNAIATLPSDLQRPMAFAFSNHLTTNCMMASYASGWRRLTPLFSVRAFRHIQRPVEINPWVDGTGRGSFPNAVRKLMRARDFTKSPKEPSRKGGFQNIDEPTEYGTSTILNRSSKDLHSIASNSVDIVLTDPPYFDNINYSELSEFFAPWMKQLGITNTKKSTKTIINESIVPKKADGNAGASFATDLGKVFQEMRRVLKPDGLIVFTFRHTQAEAWSCLARAIAQSGLNTSRVFPIPGEAGTGLHASKGSGLWDAVFVLRNEGNARSKAPPRLSANSIQVVEAQVKLWSKRLKRASIPFTTVDVRTLKSALLVGEALRGTVSRSRKFMQLEEQLKTF